MILNPAKLSKESRATVPTKFVFITLHLHSKILNTKMQLIKVYVQSMEQYLVDNH